MAGVETFLSFIFLIHTLQYVNSSGGPPFWFNPSSADSKSISENTASGTSVYVAIATDPEGNDLTYSINAQTPASPAFQLHPTSGELTSPPGLDAETSDSFTFEFSVTDTTSDVTSPTLTIYILDENEFPPVFNQTSYTASIHNMATSGEKVLTVYASDKDVRSSISYTIITGDTCTSTFSIDTTSGDLIVANARHLNPSLSYILTVQASDGNYTDTARAFVTALAGPSTAHTLCPDVWVPFQGSCYMFAHDQYMPFNEAEHYCIRLKGNLVHVNDVHENNFLRHLLTQFKPNDWWIGLHDQVIEGDYRWIDTDTPPSFTMWNPGEPDSVHHTRNEDCVFVRDKGQFRWEDVTCDSRFLPICEKRGGAHENEIVG